MDLEIVVSDNATDDVTSAVVASFSDRRIRYSRNNTNIGLTGNVHKLLNSAKGDYVFLLTDDDWLVPGALTRLASRLSESRSKYGLVFSAIRHFDAVTGEQHDGPSWGEADMQVAAGSAALSRTFFPCHIYSRLTLRRDLICFDDLERLAGGMYTLMYVAGRAVLNSPALYLADPLVVHTIRNKTEWQYAADYSYPEILEYVQELTAGDPTVRRVVRRQVLETVESAIRSAGATSAVSAMRTVMALAASRHLFWSVGFWRAVAKSLAFAVRRVPSRMRRLYVRSGTAGK